MRIQKYTWLPLSLTAFIVCSFVSLNYSCFAQTSSTENAIADRKFDEYGDLPTDDESAHLDSFAVTIYKNPNLRGYIIGYAEPRMERGYYLRRIFGVGNYLVETRGLGANRLVVIDGGYKEKFTTELWLIPDGVVAPTPSPTMARPQVNSSAAYKFDDECLECEPAVNLYLYGLGDGIKFYAEALRGSPDSKGLIIVRPGTHIGKRRALNEAREGEKLLAKNYGIGANRIIIRMGMRRDDKIAVVEMWIVPRGAKPPKATSHYSLNRTRN